VTGRVTSDIPVYLYFGGPDGFSKDRRAELTGWSAPDAQCCDFNDDGWPDILVSNCAENAPHLDPGSFLYWGGADGFHTDRKLVLPTTRAHGSAVGDFRRTGYLDLAMAGFSNAELLIFRGGPDGFDVKHPQRIILDPSLKKYRPTKNPGGTNTDYCEPRWLLAADFNNDGWLDLFVSQIVGPRCLILWGGPGGFSMERCTWLNVEGTLIVDGGLLRTTAGATFEIARGAKLASSGTLTVLRGTTEFNGSTAVIGGTDYGGTGAWNIHGGTNTVTSPTFAIANNGSISPSKGTILVNGGILDASTTDLRVGNAASGSGGTARGTLIVSNGLLRARSVLLGSGANALGQWTIAGGSSIVASNLILAGASGSTGTVLVTGGNLFVTNSTASAAIDVGTVGRGTFTMSHGTVTADRLVATNGAFSSVSFPTGALNLRSSLVSNGSTFSVGNGVGAATLKLLGGTSVFTDGLTIQKNAMLKGNGVVQGTSTVHGTPSPGDSPGQIEFDDLTLASNSVYQVELNGLTPGVQYDQALVNGSLWLSNALLKVTLGFSPNTGNQFRILDVDGTTTGTFDGLAEGSSYFIGINEFKISYAGDDGNDVVLTFLVPEPNALIISLLGLTLLPLNRCRRSYKAEGLK
jgi:hypothetical protein